MKTIYLTILACLLIGCASVQSKYSKTSTTELAMRHTQCVQYLNNEHGFRFAFGPGAAFMGDPRADRIKEKERIEKELLKRYTAGDKAAYLPMFSQTP